MTDKNNNSSTPADIVYMKYYSKSGIITPIVYQQNHHCKFATCQVLNGNNDDNSSTPTQIVFHVYKLDDSENDIFPHDLSLLGSNYFIRKKVFNPVFLRINNNSSNMVLVTMEYGREE